jgi:hypothetical protein
VKLKAELQDVYFALSAAGASVCTREGQEGRW